MQTWLSALELKPGCKNNLSSLLPPPQITNKNSIRSSFCIILYINMSLDIERNGPKIVYYIIIMILSKKIILRVFLVDLLVCPLCNSLSASPWLSQCVWQLGQISSAVSRAKAPAPWPSAHWKDCPPRNRPMPLQRRPLHPGIDIRESLTFYCTHNYIIIM